MSCSKTVAEIIHMWAMENYDNGGDVIVECEDLSDTMRNYDSLEDAKRSCKIHAEHKADIRGWGGCDDEQIFHDEPEPEGVAFTGVPIWADESHAEFKYL